VTDSQRLGAASVRVLLALAKLNNRGVVESSGERAEPIAGGWPVVLLDTTTPVQTDELVSRIQAAITST
jgi:hypothetical protein